MNTLMKAAGLLLGLSLLGACASLPVKAGAEDCLIVIKTEEINDTSIKDVQDFALNFSDGYKAVQFSPSFGKVMFVIKKQGVKITTITSWISKSNGTMNGEPTEKEYQIELPYKPGSIIVIDKVFSYIIKQGETSWNFITDEKWRPFKVDEKGKFIESLKKLKNFEIWEM